MLAKKDFVLLRDMVGEVVRESLAESDKKWKDDLDQRDRDLRRDIRDEMHSVVNGAVLASETRINRHIDEVKEAISDGISETVVHDVAHIKSRFHMA